MSIGKPIPLALDNAKQREHLLNICAGGGFGLLILISRPGDVTFAASPVPDLVGYEFVCASPDARFDIWKDGRVETSNLSIEEVKEFIKSRTPKWLVDKSDVTQEQKNLVRQWVTNFEHRYRVEILAAENN